MRVFYQMRTSARQASTAVTQTPAAATSSARTSASVTKASTETDALVSVGFMALEINSPPRCGASARGRALRTVLLRRQRRVHSQQRPLPAQLLQRVGRLPLPVRRRLPAGSGRTQLHRYDTTGAGVQMPPPPPLTFTLQVIFLVI